MNQTIKDTGSGCALSVSGLTKRFGKTTALDGLTFSLAEGQIAGLLGRNGAGKSTLLRILSGQLKQSEGNVGLFGMPVFDNAAALGELCMIGDTPDFGKLKNREEFFGVCSSLFPGWSKDRAAWLAERFDLPEKKLLKGYSRGMQTALLLCAGLASGARLTVFDEPSLGLDAVMRERFYDLLVETRKNHPERTFLVSTHLIDEVARVLDSAVLIDHGKLLCEGDMQTLTEGYLSISGAPREVRAAAADADILREEELAGSLVLHLRLKRPEDRECILSAPGIQGAPVSLQRLFVFLTEEKEEHHADNA